MSSFPLTNSYFSRWSLHQQPNLEDTYSGWLRNPAPVDRLLNSFNPWFIDFQPSFRWWSRSSAIHRIAPTGHIYQLPVPGMLGVNPVLEVFTEFLYIIYYTERIANIYQSLSCSSIFHLFLLDLLIVNIFQSAVHNRRVPQLKFQINQVLRLSCSQREWVELWFVEVHWQEASKMLLLLWFKQQMTCPKSFPNGLLRVKLREGTTDLGGRMS